MHKYIFYLQIFMVQRLFADVIHEAIWFMNIHKQKYPWFLAMIITLRPAWSVNL